MAQGEPADIIQAALDQQRGGVIVATLTPAKEAWVDSIAKGL